MKLQVSKKGYTLVEMTMVIALLSLLILVGAGAFQSAQDFSDWNYHALVLQKEMRRILSTMSEEIRESSPSSPTPITIGPNSIIFQIPASVSKNQVTSWTQIRYDLGSNSTVTRTVNGQATTIGSGVQAMSFIYPLNAQAAPRTVQIQITGHQTTLKRTITTTVTSQVTLRNP